MSSTKITKHDVDESLYNELNQAEHVADKNNPHGVTAEQVGAISANEETPVLPNDDLNEVVRTGFYRITSTTLNAPILAQNGHTVMVVPWDVNTVMQMYFLSGRIYYRYSYYTGDDRDWKPWYRLYSTENITKTTTDLTAGTSSLTTDNICLVYE